MTLVGRSIYMTMQCLTSPDVADAQLLALGDGSHRREREHIELATAAAAFNDGVSEHLLPSTLVHHRLLRVVSKYRDTDSSRYELVGVAAWWSSQCMGPCMVAQPLALRARARSSEE